MDFLTFENIVVSLSILTAYLYITQFFFSDFFLNAYLERYKEIQKSKEARNSFVEENRSESFHYMTFDDFKSENIEDETIFKMKAYYEHYERNIATIQSYYSHKPFSYKARMMWLFRGKRGKIFQEASSILEQHK